MGQKCIETAYGFCTYTVAPPELFIEDCYVIPEYRRTKHATHLVDQANAAGKELGCRLLTCCVNTKSGIATESTKAILSYGFKILRSTDAAVYFYKEII